MCVCVYISSLRLSHFILFFSGCIIIPAASCFVSCAHLVVILLLHHFLHQNLLPVVWLLCFLAACYDGGKHVRPVIIVDSYNSTHRAYKRISRWISQQCCVVDISGTSIFIRILKTAILVLSKGQRTLIKFFVFLPDIFYQSIFRLIILFLY